jgi:hypothetical protein
MVILNLAGIASIAKRNCSARDFGVGALQVLTSKFNSTVSLMGDGFSFHMGILNKHAKCNSQMIQKKFDIGALHYSTSVPQTLSLSTQKAGSTYVLR